MAEMDVELLKKGLEEVLSEDLNNRSSIADLRRNVFLQTNKAEEKEQQISAREAKIGELSAEVDYFKNQLSFLTQ